MKVDHRRSILSVLLAVQGGLIMLGAIMVGVGATSILPLDQMFGTDASVAAVVLGAALLLAFRTPNRMWTNLAIMYNALTLVVGLLRWSQNFGVRLTPMAMVVSVVFLVAFAVFYPRAETMEASTA